MTIDQVNLRGAKPLAFKVTYEQSSGASPQEVKRMIDRAFDALFEEVMRDRQLRTAKMSQIKMNYENEYTKLSK